MRDIVVGIGMHKAGEVLRVEDGSYLARINKCRLVWDGEMGMQNGIHSGELPIRAITGVNDSDEMGYVVVVIEQQVLVAVSDIAGERMEGLGDNLVTLTWGDGAGELRFGGEYGTEDILAYVGGIYDIEGWVHPDRDQ